MKAITTVICDDNPVTLSYISKYLHRAFQSYNQEAIISSHSSSKELEEKISDGNHYDLYFLDIDMPKLNGIELGRIIREKDPGAVILFVSAKEEYVFDTFQVNAYRFIRKSNFEADINEAIHTYCTKMNMLTPEYFLTLQVQNEVYRIDLNKVLYIESKDKYLDVVTAEETLVIRYKISDLEKLLQTSHFLRIHKSFLVNCRYIYQIKGRQLFLDNGKDLPVSRYRVDEVLQKYMEYLQ